MNVHHHHHERGFDLDDDESSQSLAQLGCSNRFRPLHDDVIAISAVDSSGSPGRRRRSKLGSPEQSHHQPNTPPPTATAQNPGGGTRWNPTPEQIGILEMLYRSGMRTPNAQQIEQITAQLGKYGKIEGKNVFYWFQNHKARDRQKQKRNSSGVAAAQLLSSSFNHHHIHLPPPTLLTLDSGFAVSQVAVGREEERSSPNKKWWTGFERLGSEEKNKSYYWCGREEHEGDRTLELFPLHPELGRS